MTLLQMSGMGTVLILWVLLLRRLAGRRLPPLCYLLLWLVACLRLAVPVVLASPYSVYQLFVRKQPAAINGPAAVQTVAAPLPASVSVEPIDQFTVPWLAVLWLAGLLLCLCGQLFSHWRCRRWYAMSLPAEDPAVRQWQCRHRLRRTYQIRRSQLVQVPLTYGLLRPVIILPARQPADQKQLATILLHEWNHIRHWDVLWQWGLLLVCSLHWFNPAVWLMARVCRQDLELLCDAATARQLSQEERRDYALLLLQTAGEARQIPLFSQFCHAGYGSMQERMQIIMQKRQDPWRTVVITACLVIAACLLFTTSAVAAGANGQLAQELKDSIITENGAVQFQIPAEYAADNGWTILVSGRMEAEGMGGISQHFFEQESAENSWQAGKIYKLDLAGNYTDLSLTVCYPATAEGTNTITESWNLLQKDSGQPAKQNGRLSLQWPVACQQSAVTSPFGNRVHPVTKAILANDHICIGDEGIQGAAVLAAADGVVLETGYTPSDGNYVIVAHSENGTAETHYRHCATVTVQPRQQVTAGEQIGTVGQTGMATGPCLAFAVYQNGVACDPMKYFDEIE